MAQAPAAKTGLNGGSDVAAALEQPDRGVWGSFTDKAVVLLEEAISMVRLLLAQLLPVLSAHAIRLAT